MICLKWKICKENKKQKDQNALYMIISVYSRRYESYRMYLEGDCPHQIVMQSCDVFHTQHAIFFATFDTCVGTMWFSHHKVYMC